MASSESTTNPSATYWAVAHVLWELPFPLRLPAHAFPIWEPAEGVAAIAPHPDVGELSWKRRCSFLSASDVFSDPGPGHECYPLHHYLIKSEKASGATLNSARLTGGPDGGFQEARPYTTANIFLCLRDWSEHASDSVLTRASAALNNLLDVYRFITMDPLVRSMGIELDSYYTLVSTARLPRSLRVSEPATIFKHLSELRFATELGKGRAHRVGLNSFDDLGAGDVLPDDTLTVLDQMAAAPHDFELFHQLVFSSIRRLKRKEHALSILDAESAFESLVTVLVFEDLRATLSEEAAEVELAGPVHTLQRRLEYLDRAARIHNPALKGGFLGSQAESAWRGSLYRLRNRISHEGLRTVGFAEAKQALVSGLKAADCIQGLCTNYRRRLSWSGAALELTHLEETAGRISRLFEA